VTDIDKSYEVAKVILNEATANLENIRSEEDAKLQVITRLLTEALGWAHADISAERHNENGFSDYIVSDGDHEAFVVEAKKVGIIGVTTQATTKMHYKISGPALRDAYLGIGQAASYAAPLGIQLATLTDGYTWIVFLPYTPGSSYREKQAIVFPGFDAILHDYGAFYELLSKEECRKNTYKLLFDQVHENRLVQTATLVAAFPLSDIIVEQKSALAFDLENVFSSYFSGLAGDDDPDLLINCFVETRESRVADFSLERITTNVLGNIGPSDRTVDEGLHSIISSTIEGEPGQTVFIVGPSGAGKTTFLDRFFKKTLPQPIRERCVVLHVNALEATGDIGTAIPWMTNKVIELIERDIFKDGFPEWNDLQALYQGEYIKRSKGVDAYLYARDKDAFKEKFATYVEEQVEKDREGYMGRLLRDIVNNRRKLPIFVIDNTDEFGLPYKEAVFQYFQSISKAARHCLLIFPATDKSAWSFSKTEIFNIYASKSFFLPTPSPREVFRKRIEYLKGKLNGVPGGRTQAEYFVGQGIKVKIPDLEAFASVLESIFVDQDYAAKRLGELSNYNMRKTLKLSKRVITSAMLGVDDIVKSYLVGEIVTPSADKFMNALLKGDYSLFRRDDDHELFSMFEVDSTVRQSPLTNIRILSLLREAHTHAAEDVDRYMTVKSIYAYFELMSFAELAVERSLVALMEARLIEPYDLSMKEYSQDQRLAITYSGLAHLELGLSSPTYFEQMALTSRTTNSEVAGQIRGAYLSTQAVARRLEIVRATFARYLTDEDARFGSVPVRHEFAVQAQMAADILAQWTGQRNQTVDAEPETQPGVVAEGVVARVEKFDQYKGFGFVSVPELRDEAFLHARVVEAAGFEAVRDGDDILCDIVRNTKGFAVSIVHDVVTPKSKVYSGSIIRLFEDRGYGFVDVPELGQDAFFHYSLFPRPVREGLEEGMELSFEVQSDPAGKLQVRKVVE